MIKFCCPNCGKRFEVAREWAGKKAALQGLWPFVPGADGFHSRTASCPPHAAAIPGAGGIHSGTASCPRHAAAVPDAGGVDSRTASCPPHAAAVPGAGGIHSGTASCSRRATATAGACGVHSRTAFVSPSSRSRPRRAENRCIARRWPFGEKAEERGERVDKQRPVERKPPMRIRRLMADAEQMSRVFAHFPLIRIVSVEGNPPDKYRIEYNVRGLARSYDGQPIYRDQHLVEIQLTSDYPRQSPKCRMLTPIFHPNFDPSIICVGDHWTAAEKLADLVVRIGEMIAYQAYNIKSPLDGEAAMWADLNQKCPSYGQAKPSAAGGVKHNWRCGFLRETSDG